MKKTLFAALLVLSLLLALPVLAEGTEAQDITELCTFTPSNAKKDLPNMFDDSYKTYWSSTRKGYLEITSPDDTPMYGLYINWAQYITNWSLQVPDENGEWVTIRPYEPDLFNTVYNEYVPFDQGYTHVRLLCQSPDDRHALHISEMHVLGEGEVPSWVQQWNVLYGKADMVLLVTDPGDEYIYFGGLLPYYAAQGKQVMLCVIVNTNWVYKSQLLDGLWHCGITTYPYIAYFKPNLCRSLKAQYETWGELQFVRHVTRIVRIYEPDVLVTHSSGGEGGDGGHMACADAARRAVSTAMDDSYDVGYGVTIYGNWQLKKLYLHNTGDSQITLDYNQPLDFFDGKTAMEVAQEAYAMQSYQRKSVPELRTDGYYNGAVFGLIYSNVGDDVTGGDFFENLEE